MKRNDSNQVSDELIVIYRETVNEFYEFVLRRTSRSRELAEDVTQEAYLRAATVWPDKGLPDEPLAWLQTVSRNLLANHYRRRQPALFDAADIDAMLACTTPSDTESAAVVCWGLARMRARHARLLEAFYIDDRSVRSIATDFGVSERAIEGRLRRARLALRRILLPHVGTKGELT